MMKSNGEKCSCAGEENCKIGSLTLGLVMGFSMFISMSVLFDCYMTGNVQKGHTCVTSP